jgi:hypothetical protein
MRLTQAIEETRRTHDMHDIVGSKKKKIVCPLPMHRHKNNTPSFSIYWRNRVQHFACHGNCGMEGDVVDLVGYLRITGYDRNQLPMRKAALSLLTDRFEAKIVVPEKDTVLEGNEWREFLPPGPDVIAYAAQRGLTSETLAKFMVGQSDHWMSMPCFQEGRLRGIKLRNMRPGLRYMSLAGSRAGLFNYDRVYLTHQPVLIVKAEIPAMLLDQLGFLACAPTGGEGSWRDSKTWRTALAFARKIVVGDNDDVGRKLGEVRADLLNAELTYPPDPYKDLDEFYLASPDECVQTIQGWTA